MYYQLEHKNLSRHLLLSFIVAPFLVGMIVWFRCQGTQWTPTGLGPGFSETKCQRQHRLGAVRTTPSSPMHGTIPEKFHGMLLWLPFPRLLLVLLSSLLLLLL